MVSDDASTLPLGSSKIELAWTAEDRLRGLGAVVGHALRSDLEAEITLDRTRDGSHTPAGSWYAAGLGLKWATPVSDDGHSAVGLKLDAGREHPTGQAVQRTAQLLLLFTQQLGSHSKLHLNLGRSWTHTDADAEPQAVTLGALGLDVALAEPLALVVDAYREAHGPWGRQLGLRWQVAEGIKLNAATGRLAGGPSQWRLGVAWEF